MQREIYRGRVVDLRLEHVTLPNGAKVELEIIRHKGAAGVVAIDDDGAVVLIRQFRHAAGGFLWELPAGVFDKPGEAPEVCAARELREETGLTAERLKVLGKMYPTPGYSDECIHLFLAEGLREHEASHGHDEVITDVRRVPMRTALEMVRSGEIVDGKTVVGLHLGAVHLGVGFEVTA